jgi:arginyl-tRNA synthetase
MNLLALLRDRFAAALSKLGVDAVGVPALIETVLPSQDAKFGDYQANCAMPLGKKLGRPPREIATDLVARLDLADLCLPPEIAGPGFINLRLRDDWICEALSVAIGDVERLGMVAAARPRTFVIDFSSPNVAKPMHVGHIRSTVIGDALYRVLAFLGHRVISDNHLGDWGTQFGMIIYGYKHFAVEQAIEQQPVEELTRVYKLVNSLVEYHEARNETIPALKKQIAEDETRLAELQKIAAPIDPKEAKKLAKRVQQAETALAERQCELATLDSKLAAVELDERLGPLLKLHPDIGRAVLEETARLHSGDATNIELWRRFLPPCLAEINATYQRLGVRFDHTLGESFYQDRLRGVVKSLLDRGIAKHSEGAVGVFLDGYDAPLLVQKQDGAFLYATTDLATIQYRMETWRPDAILYVVDHRQSLHFEQLFAAARRWGYADVELQHVAFGTVLGEDGRPFKTRSGTSVGLAGLLDEAIERAYAIVCQNDDERREPLLSDEERLKVAERIGIGAIKYADLAHNRTSDYVFSYDKMLAMIGNTAAYMQNSYARVSSIFEKGKVDVEKLRREAAGSTDRIRLTSPHERAPGATAGSSSSAFLLGTPPERALALSLLRLAESLDRVVADYRPNFLTAYLFDVASQYHAFYENCPVLQAESDELRTSRLLLCDLTARTLKLGLNLLGIETVERM